MILMVSKGYEEDDGVDGDYITKVVVMVVIDEM